MEELGRLTAEDFRQAEKMPIVVVLENIRSMQNVGSVFRTCDAFRVQELWLAGYTPHPPHRDIHKTALGSTETVTWRACSSGPEAAQQLRNKGYRVYAVEQAEPSTPLQQLQWDGHIPVALIFGNEALGVEDATLACCDGCIEIPQLGTKHSLNISVAAGIVLWELVRQQV